MDTMGIKRDPINCEKAWLDFAVRLLSREAVGKGRGQETVWGAKCKPSWWDRTVGHPWKNPTANPKDTKEVLLEKYEALESHLRVEKRFPPELEEESRLWKEGKYRELFLMTSLTSLLGKVTSVHSAVEDACVKVNELKASVHQSILANIQNCLKSSLKRTEQLNHAQNHTIREGADVKIKTKKRNFHVSGLQKENSESSPTKQIKFENHQGQNLLLTSACKQDLSHSDRQSTDILAFAKKLIAKRKSQPPKSSMGRNSSNIFTSRPQREILPKVVAQAVSQPNVKPHISPLSTAIHNSQPSAESSYTSPLNTAIPNSQPGVTSHTSINDNALNTNKPSATSHTTPLSNTPPICTVTVTPEQLSYLLSQNSATKLLTTNDKASDPAVEPVQTVTPEPPTFCTHDVKQVKKLTINKTNCSKEAASRFSSIDRNFSMSGGYTDESVSTDHNVFPEQMPLTVTNFNPSSTSSVGHSTTLLPCSEDEDLDLSFLNSVDIEKLCNEIFNGSQSSNDADPTCLLSMDKSQSDSQNCLNTVKDMEKDQENGSGSDLNCLVVGDLDQDATSYLATFDQISHVDNHRKVEARVLSSSASSDFGYCSEGSPPCSTSTNPNPIQKDSDPELDPSFLLDKFLSYTENPFYNDLL